MLSFLLVAALSTGQMSGVDILRECLSVSDTCRDILWDVAVDQKYPDTAAFVGTFGLQFQVCPTNKNVEDPVIWVYLHNMELPVKFLDYWEAQDDPERLINMTAREAATEALVAQYQGCGSASGT